MSIVLHDTFLSSILDLYLLNFKIRLYRVQTNDISNMILDTIFVIYYILKYTLKDVLYRHNTYNVV